MHQSQLMQKIRTGPLAAHSERLIALTRQSVLIKAEPQKRVAFKCSKFGGNPDLPDSLRWPVSGNGEPFTFIAQLNLSEIESTQPALPQAGVLFLFFDLDGAADEAHPHLFPLEVLFQENPLETRFPKERPDAPTAQRGPNLLKQAFALFGLTDGPAPIYKPCNECAVSFDSTVSLPCTGSHLVEELGFNKQQNESYFELGQWLNEDYYNNGGFANLLGYADPVQGDIMEIECYLDSIGRRDFPKTIDAEIKAAASGWMLLLQLDALDECDMYWGDGLLYIWILKSDFANRDFSRCKGILQYT